jgi:hypothetical protein
MVTFVVTIGVACSKDLKTGEIHWRVSYAHIWSGGPPDEQLIRIIQSQFAKFSDKRVTVRPIILYFR